jgi:hypothetical protein
VPPNCLSGSDVEAEPEVVNGVEVLLAIGGSSCAGATNGNSNVSGKPAATATCGSGAGCPSRTNVGLADQVVDLHSGGLAAQAGEGPPAALELFSLGVHQKFESHESCANNRAGAQSVLSSPNGSRVFSALLLHICSSFLHHRVFLCRCACS